MKNVMKGNIHFRLVMLAALTMTVVSCNKDNDDTPDPTPSENTNTIEITNGCGLRLNSTDPSVAEYSFQVLILFEKGINPNNFYINGTGELGTGRVINLHCCCLNEEVAKLERGEIQKMCYDLLVSGTYTWDGSQENKHLRIMNVVFDLYENDKRVERYLSNNGEVKACTVEIKRGHLGEQYEVAGEITLTDGKKFAIVWNGGRIQHRYNAQ